MFILLREYYSRVVIFQELIIRYITGLILGLCPANERWRYFVTLTGWPQAYNEPFVRLQMGQEQLCNYKVHITNMVICGKTMEK